MHAVPAPQLLTIRDVARLLNVSARTVKRYVRDGKLHPFRLGRRLYWTEESFVEQITRHQQRAVPQQAPLHRLYG